jgi:aldehyde:ferredoxin oxidoreductase
MVQGLANKILRVDLNQSALSVEVPEEDFYRRYLGGAGFVAYYLLKELSTGTDPLSPDNILIFANGPLTGTPVTGAARSCFGAKSPLTGGIAKSEVGGFFGHELKRAGFDGIVVKGQATSPVYLWIHDGEYELRDASHLWGKTVDETQDALEAELEQRLVRSAIIGPPAEKLSRISAIMTDVRNAAGRGGLGAVMGSKNLKAIGVKGRQVPQAAEHEKLLAVGRWMNNNYMHEGAAHFHEYGTGSDIIEKNLTGVLAINNWGDGHFEGAEQITAQRIKDTVRVAMEACPACQLRCKKVVALEHETYKVDRRGGGPEYETLAAFGSFCGVDDLDAICKANEICSFYSLDTISTGCTIAFAMECFENGLLTLEDTGGIDLRFGNAEAMVKVTELIAKREGIGDLLAEGSLKAAQQIGKGAEQYVMTVKGLELGMHEPRLKQGLGISYAINPHGGDHMTVIHDTQITQDGPYMQKKMRQIGVTDPLRTDDLGPAKVEAVMRSHIWRLFGDSVVTCHFVPWSLNQQTEMVKLLTGWDFSTVEAMRIGERVASMSRAFNMREGLTAADDSLPNRFFSPTPRGALKDKAIDPEAFDKAIHMFYGMMGWDSETGLPTPEKLQTLGIGWVDEHIAHLRDQETPRVCSSHPPRGV